MIEFVLENPPRDYKIAGLRGGNGANFIDHSLLNRTHNLVSIVGTQDDGGQSGFNKGQENPSTGIVYVPAGDAVGAMETHTRALKERELYVRQPKGDPLHPDKRLMTDLIGARMQAFDETFSQAIEFYEYILRHVYRGHVLTQTDENVDLKLFFENGSSVVGEHFIDDIKPGDSPIKRMEIGLRRGEDGFLPYDFPVNPKVLYNYRTAHGICISPGTVHGSIDPLLMSKQTRETLAGVDVPIIWLPNIMNHPETEGWTPERHAQHLVEELEIPVTHALFSSVSVDIPPRYTRLINGRPYSTPVVSENEDEAKRQADKVRRLIENVEFRGDLVNLQPYEDRTFGHREILVHDGEVVANRIISILDEHWQHPKNGYRNGSNGH